jgi:hypothetical protein
MKRSKYFLAALVGLSLLVWTAIAGAQDDTLQLTARKEFGYAWGGQIQGLFKFTATGPSDLISVTFKLTDKTGNSGTTTLAQVTQAPFAITFNTDSYPHGQYEFSAMGQTASGRRLTSNTLPAEFVSAEAGLQMAGRIVIPIVVLIAVSMLAATLGPFILERLGRKAPPLPAGAVRNYGWLGGAICPRCQRPFGLHWWALNISLAGKFDRCPHCGRWSLVRRASREALAAAEAAELVSATAPEPDPAEKLRKQLEDSRYV